MPRFTDLETKVILNALTHAEAAPTDWEEGLADELGGAPGTDGRIRDAITSAIRKIQTMQATRERAKAQRKAKR